MKCQHSYFVKTFESHEPESVILIRKMEKSNFKQHIVLNKIDSTLKYDRNYSILPISYQSNIKLIVSVRPGTSRYIKNDLPTTEQPSSF